MKICMILSLPFPPEEGIGYYTYFLSKKLLDNGHDVVIMTRGSWKKVQMEKYQGIEVIKVPFIPLYPFYLKIHGMFLSDIFRELEPSIDLIHYHSPLPPLIKTKCPIVTTIHTPMLTDYRYIRMDSAYSFFSKLSARLVSYPMEKKLIKASNVVMTVSNSIAQELNEEYFLETKKICIVGNGVDEKYFCPGGKKTEERKYIIYVGKIDAEKGVYDLLECGKIVCEKKPDVSFMLAGRGRDYETLKARIKDMGLQEKFLLLGQVSKERLLSLYQNAVLCVFPSYHEGLPTVLLEAMACGLPIVSTDVRGNRDIVKHGENGVLVPPRDPRALATAILSLIDDETLAKSYGENARKFIENNYTGDQFYLKVLRCYELALDKGR